MYMTGVAAGDSGLVPSNNHVYYSTSWTNDGVNWSIPAILISKHWLPSATIGPSGHVYLYANDNSIHGQVVRFDLGASGVAVGTPQMVTAPAGRFYSNVHVMYRPALGFYQILAEYHRPDGSGAIDYLDSTDGLIWNLVHSDIVVPDTAVGELSVGSPAPHPDTHGIVYFGSTAQADSMGFKIRVQSWQSSVAPPPPPPPPSPVCGNGTVETGEECDSGSSNGVCPATCSTSCTVNSCPPPPLPPPSEIEVFFDSFEVGEWNGLWTEDSQNDWFRSSQRAIHGSRSAEVDGPASDARIKSIPINLQGKTSATITFSWYIESGLDSGEYLAFDVSTNGGSSWTEKAKLSGNVSQENTWQNASITLSGINKLQIRFRGKMSESEEDANVDNVRVLAK